MKGVDIDEQALEPALISEGHSVFTAIEKSNLPDEESFVLHRGETCFVVLNLFPYTTGHTLVLPKVPHKSLTDLTQSEYVELWATVRDAVTAIECSYVPDGVNIGLNLGKAAGAGIPDHLHVHCVPRWLGDTNFMTAISGTRVLPEVLGESWKRLKENWPA